MFSAADKFFVALLLAGANVVRSRYDIDFGLTDQMAADIVGFVMAAAVWLVPNKGG
jgi:hypothetical protein